MDSWEDRIRDFISNPPDNQWVIFVDFPNSKSLQAGESSFRLSNCTFQNISDFSGDGYRFVEADLRESIKNGNMPLFILGITPYLLLQGYKSINTQIESFMKIKDTIRPIVFFTRNLTKFVELKDPRISPYFIEVEGKREEYPIVFQGSSPEGHFKSIDSLDKLDKTEEKKVFYDCSVNLLKACPYSLLDIKQLQPFDRVKKLDLERYYLSEVDGTNSEWNYLADLAENEVDFAKVIDRVIGDPNHLELQFKESKDWDDKKNWLYFLALKAFGIKSNNYLKEAVEGSKNLSEVTRKAYRNILNYSPESLCFNKVREQRLSALEYLPKNRIELENYLGLIDQRDDILFFLSDRTDEEKKIIIQEVAKVDPDLSNQETKNILEKIYPDLYYYLDDYLLEDNRLTQYFKKYKKQKFSGTLDSDNDQILSDIYNEGIVFQAIRPRSSVLYETLEGVNLDRVIVYLIDGLGIEYAGYLLGVLNEKMKLNASLEPAQSELPTFTAHNKKAIFDFYEERIGKNSIKYFKDLDEFKHENPDQDKETIPYTFLAKELQIIGDILERVKGDLESGQFDKVIITSDHGSSRLAKIVKNDYFDIGEKEASGNHGGRCACFSGESLPYGALASEDTKFLSSATYKNFRGGHRSGKELHGGATPEEILIPVIEVTRKNKIEPEIYLLDKNGNPVPELEELEIIKDRKNPVVIQVFSSIAIKNPKIKIEENIYDGQQTGIKKFDFKLENIQELSLGNKLVDIYSNGNLLKKGLRIKLVGQIAQVKERGIFGEL